MTLKRLAIVLLAISALAAVGIMTWWHYVASPVARARGDESP